MSACRAGRGPKVADQFGPGASIGNEEQAVMESEYQEVVEVKPPHDTECLDGGYDPGEEMETSAVLPRQRPRFIELLTDDSHGTYPRAFSTISSDKSSPKTMTTSPNAPGVRITRCRPGKLSM